MANVKVVRNVAFIESAASLKEIQNLAKHRPNALVLRDESKRELYRIAVGTGEGSISKFGATFGSQADPEKKAAITVHIPDDVTDAKAYIAETYGAALLKINEIEKGFADAATEITAELKKINESITVE